MAIVTRSGDVRYKCAIIFSRGDGIYCVVADRREIAKYTHTHNNDGRKNIIKTTSASRQQREKQTRRFFRNETLVTNGFRYISENIACRGNTRDGLLYATCYTRSVHGSFGDFDIAVSRDGGENIR